MIGANGPLGLASSPVRVMKKQLRAIGFQLHDNGVIDAPTVAAVNSVLVGWDDAPARFKTGRLDARQIQKEMREISALIRRAVGTATGFDRLPE